MKKIIFQLIPSLAALALVAPSPVFAQGKGGGGSTSGSTAGPVVIPGGAYTSMYAINDSGYYLLGGNRSTDGSVNVIEINATDVTLDLNGFVISQTASGSKSGIVVTSTANVEIRNGSIVHAGLHGIWAKSGKNLRVSNVRIAVAGGNGIYAEATNAQIEPCRINDCGGYALWTGAASLVSDCVVDGPSVQGISVMSGSRVVRTVVHGASEGIALFNNCAAVECTVTGCTFSGVRLMGGSSLRGSDVSGCQTGVTTIGATANMIATSNIGGNTSSDVYGGFTDGLGNNFY